MAKWNKLHPQTLEKQYKEKLSDFLEWSEEVNVEALVYPDNFGERMSLDEVALHNGEFYTVITNKAAKGKKGALAALIKGTKNEIVSEALKQVPTAILMNVREITVDFANSMDWICRTNFMNAVMVGDRFHAQQIVSEGVQEIRIGLRRKAIDEENRLIVEAKEAGRSYTPERYTNGDTKKQLLARGRYLIFKPKSKWTDSQIVRAQILFEEFPSLKSAYMASMKFRNIFETIRSRDKAEEAMKAWLEEIACSSSPTKISVGNSINNNLGKILNYFPEKSTNASAESFNAKLKGFRALVRGVRDIKFFLFRIETFYS